MGKIIYSCRVVPDYLHGMENSPHLPASFQKAVKSKRLVPEKLKENIEEKNKDKPKLTGLAARMAGSSFPCWELEVEDKLNGSTPGIKVSESSTDFLTSPLVIVDCEFDKWSEVQYFLDRGIGYLQGYHLNKNTPDKIREEVKKQIKKYEDKELKPNDKVSVKIKYELKY